MHNIPIVKEPEKHNLRERQSVNINLEMIQKLELIDFKVEAIAMFNVLRGYLIVVQSLSVSNSLWPYGWQHTRFPCPPLCPRVCLSSCLLRWWWWWLSLLPSSPFAFNVSQHQGLFQWARSLYRVAKVLELQLKHQSFWWMLRVNFL